MSATPRPPRRRRVAARMLTPGDVTTSGDIVSATRPLDDGTVSVWLRIGGPDGRVEARHWGESVLIDIEPRR